jgi:acyl-CoA thioester hydrolase
MEIVTPFDAYRDRVRSEWIDYNQHMNMGYYLVVFDLATDEWLDYIGLTGAHRARHRVTTFSLEAHVTYERELEENDPLRVSTRLLDHDEKRIHYFHELYHAEEGYLAATNELISLHVSLETRRATPMAPDIQANLHALAAAHGELPVAPQVGRIIGLESKPSAA